MGTGPKTRRDTTGWCERASVKKRYPFGRGIVGQIYREYNEEQRTGSLWSGEMDFDLPPPFFIAGVLIYGCVLQMPSQTRFPFLNRLYDYGHSN